MSLLVANAVRCSFSRRPKPGRPANFTHAAAAARRNGLGIVPPAGRAVARTRSHAAASAGVWQCPRQRRRHRGAPETVGPRGLAGDVGGRRGLRWQSDCRNPSPRLHRRRGAHRIQRTHRRLRVHGRRRAAMPRRRTHAGGQNTFAIRNRPAARSKICKRFWRLAGFDLADTVRTWFFLENILSWYDDFNRARTKIYSGVKFRTGSLPASTGVGAKNPAGAALALAAWAFQPVGKNSYAEEVASPLQCPAPAYGSSFSRAMEISIERRTAAVHFRHGEHRARRKNLVGRRCPQAGGTDDGRGPRQSCARAGFNFAELTRATAYFRRTTDAAVFAEWLPANRLEQMPVVSAQCDVCRDDLLFELEGEAWRPMIRGSNPWEAEQLFASNVGTSSKGM